MSEMEAQKRKRPTWIAPGLVMCGTCFVPESFRCADDHWLWNEPDVWTCPKCEKATPDAR